VDFLEGLDETEEAGMTHKTTAFALAMAVLMAVSGPVVAKDKVVESLWASAPVIVDGLEQDWQGLTFLTDGGSKAQYALKNDGKNLYIVFLFKDPLSPSTIEFTGLKVFFSPEGKKSRDLGVHFVKKSVTADALIAYLEKKGEALTEARKAEIRKKSEYTLFETDVINAKKIAAPADPAVQTDPPVFSAKSQNKALVYEFRIPLGRTNQPGGLGAEPGQTVKLGFEWGGMTRQIMQDMMAGQSSRAGMSHQGAGLDGSVADTREDSGGMQGGGDYRRDPRTRLHSFWIDLKLAAR
jgi:hypothetical protein